RAGGAAANARPAPVTSAANDPKTPFFMGKLLYKGTTNRSAIPRVRQPSAACRVGPSQLVHRSFHAVGPSCWRFRVRCLSHRLLDQRSISVGNQVLRPGKLPATNNPRPEHFRCQRPKPLPPEKFLLPLFPPA